MSINKIAEDVARSYATDFLHADDREVFVRDIKDYIYTGLQQVEREAVEPYEKLKEFSPHPAKGAGR